MQCVGTKLACWLADWNGSLASALASSLDGHAISWLIVVICTNSCTTLPDANCALKSFGASGRWAAGCWAAGAFGRDARPRQCDARSLLRLLVRLVWLLHFFAGGRNSAMHDLRALQ